MILVGIGSAPAAGKSTLMRALMKEMSFLWSRAKEGLVVWEEHGNTAVLGEYDYGHPYAGTDRLSMACQPKVLEWLKRQVKKDQFQTVLFEGSRLFNKSFLTDCVSIPGLTVKVVLLRCSDKELDRRHKERNDDDAHMAKAKGRATQAEGVFSLFKDKAIELRHESPKDTKKCVRTILDLIGE